MNPYYVLGFVGFAGVMALAIAVGCWQYRRGYGLLKQWCKVNGYRLLSSELRSLRKGPFFFKSSKYQNVYYVTIEDRAGERKTGFVRCGGFWKGMRSEEVVARWDNEAA